VAEVRPDALIVAGDVYDRAVPPPDAVTLLDEILTRVVLDLRVPVIVIAGNHDGPDRLAFGSRILADRGLHVIANPTASPVPLRLRDEHGVVEILAAPYADPATMRAVLARDDLVDHDTALAAWLTRASAARDPSARGVLVGHAFVRGGAESESERPLSIGGASAVDAAHFAGFAYVALGHLHRPQAVTEDGAVAYSGSLLKYSFAEADHVKSVNVVEIDERGAVRVEAVPLSPRRDVRNLEGTLGQVLHGAERDPARDDYLRVKLTDTQALFDPMGKLRSVYPNVLELDRVQHEGADPLARSERVDHRKLGDLELLDAFFREVTGDPLAPDDRRLLSEVLEAARGGDVLDAP